jgi:hypothetical protein
MISTNYENENKAEFYFDKFAISKKSMLNEAEFILFLKSFLIEHNREDLLANLIQENMFNIYLEKGLEEMDKVCFCTVFNELILLIKSGENENALDVDFKFEEDDLKF